MEILVVFLEAPHSHFPAWRFLLLDGQERGMAEGKKKKKIDDVSYIRMDIGSIIVIISFFE